MGRIAKPHGLRGEVIVELSTNRPERVAAGSVLTTDKGPLKVLHSSPHQGRWIVAFDGAFRREDADALRGLVLRASPIEDPDALWVHELIGSQVVDQHGTARGTVTSVQDNPASDLLVLDDGHLVPLRFVTASAAGVVTVEVPEGLFE